MKELTERTANVFHIRVTASSGSRLSLQVSAVPQESRTLKSTVPEGAELQAECLLVREVKCVCVCLCVPERGRCYLLYCGLSVETMGQL